MDYLEFQKRSFLEIMIIPPLNSLLPLIILIDFDCNM